MSPFNFILHTVSVVAAASGDNDKDTRAFRSSLLLLRRSVIEDKTTVPEGREQPLFLSWQAKALAVGSE